MSLKNDYATMRIKRKTTETTMAVRLDTSQVDFILRECIEREISISVLLRELIESGLEEYKKKKE